MRNAKGRESKVPHIHTAYTRTRAHSMPFGAVYVTTLYSVRCTYTYRVAPNTPTSNLREQKTQIQLKSFHENERTAQNGPNDSVCADVCVRKTADMNATELREPYIHGLGQGHMDMRDIFGRRRCWNRGTKYVLNLENVFVSTKEK